MFRLSFIKWVLLLSASSALIMGLASLVRGVYSPWTEGMDILEQKVSGSEFFQLDQYETINRTEDDVIERLSLGRFYEKGTGDVYEVRIYEDGRVESENLPDFASEYFESYVMYLIVISIALLLFYFEKRKARRTLAGNKVVA